MIHDLIFENGKIRMVKWWSDNSVQNAYIVLYCIILDTHCTRTHKIYNRLFMPFKGWAFQTADAQMEKNNQHVFIIQTVAHDVFGSIW